MYGRCNEYRIQYLAVIVDRIISCVHVTLAQNFNEGSSFFFFFFLYRLSIVVVLEGVPVMCEFDLRHQHSKRRDRKSIEYRIQPLILAARQRVVLSD